MQTLTAHLSNVAYGFAACAHGKQKRKYTGEPYIVHPASVASIVRDYTDNPNVVAAALLHDVLEDTDVTVAEMRAVFGDEVTSLVLELTDVSRPQDGNRETRKALDRDHLAEASAAGATIKLADLIDNTASIVKHDRRFAKVYLEEKAAVLEVLTRGHPALLERARRVLSEARAEIAGTLA